MTVGYEKNILYFSSDYCICSTKCAFSVLPHRLSYNGGSRVTDLTSDDLHEISEILQKVRADEFATF